MRLKGGRLGLEKFPGITMNIRLLQKIDIILSGKDDKIHAIGETS